MLQFNFGIVFLPFGISSFEVLLNYGILRGLVKRNYKQYTSFVTFYNKYNYKTLEIYFILILK